MDDDTLCATGEGSDGIPTIPDGAVHHVMPKAAEIACDYDPVAEDGAQSPTPLKIAFSVYTATNGYDWSSIPEGCERSGMDFYYQKAVERKPDFMSPGDVVKGVFACDGNIAAFRIQELKHWDSFGRNADYCAFAFLPYEDARRVDFEALLSMSEFADPRHDPPTSVSYSGDTSKDINSEESVAAIEKLYRGETLQSFDFAKIGALLSIHGKKSTDWLFCKVECATEDSTTVSTGDWTTDPYPPPPPPPPTLPSRVESSASAEETLHKSLSTAQRIAPIAPSILVQESTMGSESVDRTNAPRMEAVIARRPAQSPIVMPRQTYRSPMDGRIHGGYNNTKGMTPVSPEELKRISETARNASHGLFGLDAPTLVLAGICAILVVVLLWILGRASIVGNPTLKQSTPKTDEIGIREINSTDDAQAGMSLRTVGM